MPDSNNLNLILTFMERMFAPIQAGLTKVSESLVELTSQTNNISVLMRQEPTRQTIINTLGDLFDEHTDKIEDNFKEHDRECASRNVKLDSVSGERAQKVLTDALAALAKVQDSIGSVAEMGKKFDQLTWTIRVGVGLTLAAAGYLGYALKQTSH